jgi:hypothetical protein
MADITISDLDGADLTNGEIIISSTSTFHFITKSYLIFHPVKILNFQRKGRRFGRRHGSGSDDSNGSGSDDNNGSGSESLLIDFHSIE